MEKQKIFLYILIGVVLFAVLLIGLTKRSSRKTREE